MTEKPTIIDVEICSCAIAYRDTSIAVDFKVTSNTEFQKPTVYTLGFRSRKSETRVSRIGDGYTSGDLLETFQSSQIRIPPFVVNCFNLGDAQMAVYVRMKGGMKACRITILSEDKKPKINDDDFFQSEDIWYGIAVIRKHQIVRIEELRGENTDGG
jgi:hypothetical protein